MAGVVKINITETAEELKILMSQQKSGQNFVRIQALYLLKTGQFKTVTALSLILGKHRVTIQDWLKIYRSEGIEGLLADRHSGGRKSTIPDWAIQALTRRLEESSGFKSYGEIKKWLQDTLGIEAAYQAVYELVRYKLKAKLKVVRPKSSKQNPERLKAFKLNLKLDLEILKQYLLERFKEQDKSIRYWCEDETRLGLKTIPRRRITIKGIKPTGSVQWRFFSVLYLWSSRTPNRRAFFL